MMYTRFRFFSSVLSESGRFSNRVMNILRELEKPDNYNPLLRDKPINCLFDLYISHKKDNPRSSTDWNRHKTIQFAIRNLKNWMAKYDMTQTIQLLKTLTNLKIHDEELWDIIRKHLTRKLYKEIDSDNIKDIISAFHRNEKGNDKLWNTIESILLSKIFPKQDLKPDALVYILLAFAKFNKGSQQTLLELEQQIMRVSHLIDGPSFARILSTFGRLKLGSDTLYEEIRKQVENRAGQMDQQTLTAIMKSFILAKKTTPELLAAMEEVITSSKLPTFSLANITQLAQLYLDFFNGSMKEGNPRKVFVNHILMFATIEIDNMLGNSEDNHEAVSTLKFYVDELRLGVHLKDKQYNKLREIVSKSTPNPESIRN